jgi:polyhydroxybutyrate depolymerase
MVTLASVVIATTAIAATVHQPASVSGPTPAATKSHPHAMAPGDYTEYVDVDGMQRQFILHVPDDQTSANPGLILVFHGAGDTAANTVNETNFEQVANSDGNYVAFLQGYDHTWNDGAGETPAEEAGVDDVAFTSDTIAEIEGMVTFNHNLIAVTGFSNGALMVERLGCQLAGTLAVVAPIEGELASKQVAVCHPARPISVYEVHGTSDPSISYNGGTFQGYGGPVTVLSAPNSVKTWAQLDHCSLKYGTSSNSAISLRTYRKCRGGVTVTLRTIYGGQHDWPPNVGQLVSQALAKVAAG